MSATSNCYQSSIKSPSPETKNQHRHKSVIYIGTSGGLPFYFVADLSSEELKLVFIWFLLESSIEQVGFVNGWLCDSQMDSERDLAAIMQACNNSKLFITEEFCSCLDTTLENKYPGKSLDGGLFMFGMHMPVREFWTTYESYVDGRATIISAHIHLGLHIQNTSDAPCIVAMSNLVKSEFGGVNYQWFHPIAWGQSYKTFYTLGQCKIKCLNCQFNEK